VQTNDENFEVNTQTEDIQYSTRWTQYPPDDSKGYGEGELFTQFFSREYFIISFDEFDLISRKSKWQLV
jgi:hypothetical protein